MASVRSLRPTLSGRIFVDIANRWHQPIECKRSGRHLYYYYRDPEFSIFKNPLSEEEVMEVYGAIDNYKSTQFE